MIAFGSGDPTRAICSTMIAQAFEQIRYPILPEVTLAPGRASAQSHYSRREILHIRHYSLYTPRDFDLSPYFQIVKPTLAFGFDYKTLVWAKEAKAEAAPAAAAAPEAEKAQKSPAERTASRWERLTGSRVPSFIFSISRPPMRTDCAT
jgi:hypothetical protein